MKKGVKKGLVRDLIKRGKADTPTFFKKLRMAGLVLTAIGGVLAAAPITLPAALVTAGSYLVVAGSMITAVSQVTVKNEWSREGR